MKTSRVALTVAEGLLPLLDVSVLLLGLLFVLWNVAAAQQAKQDQQREQLPGISMIILLTVEANGQLELQVPQTGKKPRIVSLQRVEDLKSALDDAKASIRSSSQDDRRPLVLIVYSDPWRMKTELGPQLARVLRAAGCRYARVFP